MWFDVLTPLVLRRPKDKRLKTVGAFQLANVEASIQSLMLREYVNMEGGKKDELTVLAAKTKRAYMNPRHHCIAH